MVVVVVVVVVSVCVDVRVRVRFGIRVIGHARAPVVAHAEHALEDRPLARIGVLEFVDQRDRVLGAQLRRERVAVFALERGEHAVDEVVVGLHAADALERGQAHRRLVAHAVQQADAGGGEPLLARGQGIGMRRDRIEQRRGRRTGVLALVGAQRQACRGEAVDALVDGAGVVADRLPGRQGRPQVGRQRGLVAAAVEHLGCDRRVELRARIVAVRGERRAHRGGGGPQRRQRVGSVGGGRRQQPRHPQQRAQVRGERIGTAPLRLQQFRLQRVGAERTPQVGGDLVAQFAVAPDHLRGDERLPGLQRMLAEHARAEAVDREHRGEVDLSRRALQAVAQRGRILVAALRVDQRAGQHDVGAGLGVVRDALRLRLVGGQPRR